MKRVNRGTFFVVLVIVAIISAITFYGDSLGIKNIKGINDIRLGIDIRGGVEAVYSPKGLDREPTAQELETAQAVLEARLDNKKILDRVITTDKNNGEILVQFPWKSDETDFNPKAAIAELGETAVLSFRDPQGNILIEGKNVKSNSKPSYDEETRGNIVEIEFDEIGAKQFEDATAKLVGKNISIYMDQTLISSPRVNEKISGGKAVITGMEDTEAAKSLSEKINSGALPFSLESKNFSTISPTLGSSALNVMIYAGILAFALICIFMILYYRIPGFVACIGLILQITLQLLCLSIPQITLTLPGIAGIILSVGMGVDTNIIIAERIKEELNNGKKLSSAIEAGYKRAFSAVFDGNVTTAIVAVVLIIFGSGSMLSFGYTLVTGVLLNFLSGITASNLMVSSLSSYKGLRNPFLYGSKKVVS